MTGNTPEVNEDFVDMLLALEANKADFLIADVEQLRAIEPRE